MDETDLQRCETEKQVYELLQARLFRDGRVLYAGELIWRAAQLYPDRVALIHKGHKLTYQEVYHRSALVARKLQKAGVKRGDRVVICFENSIDFYIAYFAAWNVGAVCVPLNTFLHEKEVAYILADAQPKVVVASSALSKKVKSALATTVEHAAQFFDERDLSLSDLAYRSVGEIDALFTRERLDDDQMCLMLYTSGTTGIPKGVMLSSRNVITNALQCTTRLAVGYAACSERFDDERFFAALPLFHVFAQNTCIWFPLIIGAAVIVVSKVDRREIIEGLNDKPTLFFGVPALYGLLCLMKTAPLDSVKFFVSGGDALSDKIRLAFSLIYGRRIGAGYGLTEASPVVAVNIGNGERPAHSVGKLLYGIDVEIRSTKSGSVLPPGSVGALWIAGDNVMLGYHGASEATDQVLRNGWLSTGDLAYINNDGQLSIVGRSKDLIIHKGFNIYPQEVENVLLSHPAVMTAAVVGKEDAQAGEVPIAFVALRQSAPDVETMLRSMCYSRLASYKIPRRFVCLETLPLNSLGKVDKKKLHTLF